MSSAKTHFSGSGKIRSNGAGASWHHFRKRHVAICTAVWLTTILLELSPASGGPSFAGGQSAGGGGGGLLSAAATVADSLTDRSLNWPSWAEWRRVLTLQDYNTRVVMLGTMLLGMAAGTIGSFTLLRRRALMGDALSHATLPGVGLAFMLAPMAGLDGKSMPVLLAGAAISGLAGVGAILFVRNLTRLKEDAALGIVLSVFFGAGIAVLSLVQQMPTGHAAGLEAFIYGKTASMVAGDAWMIGAAGLGCVLVATAVFKELSLLCFDEGYAGARGFPVLGLDILLMAMVVIVTIIGLQAVGLVLMIALLVIPAAAARFWTQDMRNMTLISALIGGISGLLGSSMSAVFPRLPSGAMIVLVSGGLFFVSMMTGASRGVVIRFYRRVQLNRSIDRQHLLRGLFEYVEHQLPAQHAAEDMQQGVPFSQVVNMRSWSANRLKRQMARSIKEGVVRADNDLVSLTATGVTEAARLVHEHRLWELYLITHAEIAPSRVDRDADAIEHVLEPEMIAQLEHLLESQPPRTAGGVVSSPHPIASSTTGDTAIEIPHNTAGKATIEAAGKTRREGGSA